MGIETCNCSYWHKDASAIIINITDVVLIIHKSKFWVWSAVTSFACAVKKMKKERSFECLVKWGISDYERARWIMYSDDEQGKDSADECNNCQNFKMCAMFIAYNIHDPDVYKWRRTGTMLTHWRHQHGAAPIFWNRIFRDNIFF